MPELLWPIRIGIVTLALVFMPAEAGDGRLSRAALCASETEDGDCQPEPDSYCLVDSAYIPDLTPKESP